MSKSVIGAAIFSVLFIIIAGMFIFHTPDAFLPAKESKETEKMDTTQIPDNLKIEEIKVGSGSAVKSGDTVSVHYVGTLTNGTKFDSSYDRNQPFETEIGVGRVIKGWDVGIVGMKVGGKRKLTIPPELGYGSADMGDIPPNSTLIFEVELVEIKN